MQIFDRLFLDRPPVPIGCTNSSACHLPMSLFILLRETVQPSPRYCVFVCRGDAQIVRVHCFIFCLDRNCFSPKLLHILTLHSVSHICVCCALFKESVCVFHSVLCFVLDIFLKVKKELGMTYKKFSWKLG